MNSRLQINRKLRMQQKYSLGFTLIELLVVIAIIALLAGIVLFGLGGSQEKARDTQRKSDLKQYQIALESYANDEKGVYPIYSGSIQNICGAGKELDELAVCPDDPDAANLYQYISNSEGTDYVIYAQLESGNNTYWAYYSNGIATGQDAVPDLTPCTPACTGSEVCLSGTCQ